jgi:hypothetical protein
MTLASIDPRTKALVLGLLQNKDEGMLPTEVLKHLVTQQVAPSEIQTALAILLDAGVIEMDMHRHLHLAEVPA